MRPSEISNRSRAAVGAAARLVEPGGSHLVVVAGMDQRDAAEPEYTAILQLRW